MSGAIKINGTSSGSTTITAPASGADETIELSTVLAAKGDIAGETWTGTHDFSGATVSGIPSGALQFIAGAAPASASSVSIDNCFTSAYQNYRITWNGYHSAGLDCTMRLRASSTDDTTSNYRWRQNVMPTSSGTFAGYYNNGDDKWRVSYVQTGSTYWCMDIFAPQDAANTWFNCNGTGASNDMATFLGRFAANTQFDGLTFFATSGSLTGSLRVYGFTNS